MRRRHHRPTTPAVLVAAALLVGVVAGCSSSDGSDGSAPATTTSAAAASTDPNAAAVGETATSEPVPSAGCGTSSVREVTGERHELADGRWYLLSTPADHDGATPLPVVLDFHGLSEGADIHALFSELGPYGQANGFVVVQPNGTGTPVAWNVSSDRTGNPDLVFVDAMLDQLEADLCVDTSRVYATGLSNGAFLSSVIACTMADRVAAVAPVAGLTWPPDCDPARPIPVIAFHGTADPILLFNGGVNGAALAPVIDPDATTTSAPPTTPPPIDLDGEGYPATAQRWATADGCTGKPTDTDLTDSVIERTWTCPAASPVEFVIVEGGGHSWPGSTFGPNIEGIVGHTDESISANDLIWKFFQRFSLPAA